MNSSSNEELIIAGDHPGPISGKQLKTFTNNLKGFLWRYNPMPTSLSGMPIL